MASVFDSFNESMRKSNERMETYYEACREEKHEMLKDCTMNAIYLASEIMQARMNKESFESLFSEFYKQCFIINVMCEWHNDTEEEKKVNKEFFKMLGHGLFSGKTQDRLKESFEEMDEEEDDPKVIRFIEIIQSRPEDINQDMKIEAIDLFPVVIQDLGVY